MGKLYEIKAELDKCGQATLPLAGWSMSYGALLIRAVRQLGKAYREAFNYGLEVDYFVDSDVLELLEEQE